MADRDMPPTPEDAAMRRKHTIESVDYNMGHFEDHAHGAFKQLKKLATVDESKAKQEASKVARQFERLTRMVKGIV